MSEGIPESRFYMWRAVFAMAHADHVVTDEERAFMENYLTHVPLSEEQKATLRQDMAEPQDVNEMLVLVSEPEDQGQFFQFARELVWCDGDLAEQEEAIKEKLNAEQMSRLNLDRLELELRQSRAEAKMQRTANDRRMEDEAEKIVGLGAMLRGMASNRR